MAKKDKIRMPQSTAGLMVYSDVESAIKIKPEYVVGAAIALFSLVLALKFIAF